MDYLAIARRHIDGGELHKAQQIVMAHRKDASGDPVVHLGWAELCEELGMARQAVECYQKALELDSENLDTLYRLAFLFLEIGYYEKSAHHLKKILRQEPEHAEARKLLQQCYNALGLRGQARALSTGRKRPGANIAERYFPPSISEEDTRIFLELFSGREVGCALQTVDSKAGEIANEFRNAPRSSNPAAFISSSG